MFLRRCLSIMSLTIMPQGILIAENLTSSLAALEVSLEMLFEQMFPGALESAEVELAAALDFAKTYLQNLGALAGEKNFEEYFMLKVESQEEFSKRQDELTRLREALLKSSETYSSIYNVVAKKGPIPEYSKLQDVPFYANALFKAARRIELAKPEIEPYANIAPDPTYVPLPADGANELSDKVKGIVADYKASELAKDQNKLKGALNTIALLKAAIQDRISAQDAADMIAKLDAKMKILEKKLIE